MENQLATLLHRTAVLMNEGDRERRDTLGELLNALRNPQTNKTRSQTVLDNEEVMDVILNLSATTRAVNVAWNAFAVLMHLASDLDNARRLFREHPSLILVAMRKLEFEANEYVQTRALGVLQSLAVNNDNARGMITKNPALVALLVAKMESNSKQVQMGALDVLQNLAHNNDNARDMATKYPTLVPLLVAKVESNSEEVRINALGVLHNLTIHVDNKREMFIKNPTFVPLLVAKVDSDSEQVQVGALDVLRNLAVNVDNKREIVTENPTLVFLLVAKVDSDLEQVQTGALKMLQSLTCNDDNARGMVTQHATFVPLLVAKVEFDSEEVQLWALKVLYNLANNVDNAREMVTKNLGLVPLLAAKMSGSTALQATMVVYNLSGPPANQAVLRGNSSVVAGLSKGRENKDTSFFSFLALVNLFGAEEDSEVLKTDLAMLQRIFEMIADAMNKGRWRLDEPLVAFRFLCAVEENRQLLWGKYGSEFLSSVMDALQRAIGDKDAPAVENAVFTLVQFSKDAESLVWMRGNKPRLDQLAPFPDALKAAQALLLTLDSTKAKRVLSDTAPAKRQKVTHPAERS